MQLTVMVTTMATTLKKPSERLGWAWRRGLAGSCPGYQEWLSFLGERGRLLFGLACYEIVISVRVRSTAGQNRVRDMGTEYIGLIDFFTHVYVHECAL